MVVLWGVGTGLMVAMGLATTWADAAYATVVLLLGGYGDLFSEFSLSVPIPWWLRLFSLILTPPPSLGCSMPS